MSYKQGCDDGHNFRDMDHDVAELPGASIVPAHRAGDRAAGIRQHHPLAQTNIEQPLTGGTARVRPAPQTNFIFLRIPQAVGTAHLPQAQA